MTKTVIVAEEPKLGLQIQRACPEKETSIEICRSDDTTRIEEAEILIIASLNPEKTEKVLKRSSQLKPAAVRIVISDNPDVVGTAYGLAHDVISLANGFELLGSIFQDAARLARMLNSEHVRSVVSRVNKLPALPQYYLQASKILEDEDYRQSDLIAVLQADPSIASSVLRIANSAYFGGRRTIADLNQAVTLLGTSTLKNVIISSELFGQFKKSPIPEFDIDKLWLHSQSVAKRVAAIARQLGVDKKMVEEGFAAGLLHDVGKLVLLTSFPDDFRRAIQLANDQALPLNEAELSVLGASHDEIGAYLLTLWGLPASIVEAVAFHHFSTEACCNKISPLSLVHVANLIDNRLDLDEEEYFDIEVFEEYLVELGQGTWRGLSKAILSDG